MKKSEPKPLPPTPDTKEYHDGMRACESGHEFNCPLQEPRQRYDWYTGWLDKKYEKWD